MMQTNSSDCCRISINQAIIPAIFLIISTSLAADPVAIIGGHDLVGTGPAYAALVTSSDELIPITFSGDMATTGTILSVSLNGSGTGLIGGQVQIGSAPAYAALVSPSGTLTPLVLPEQRECME